MDSHRLEELLLSKLSAEDQQIFVKHFQVYLKHASDTTSFVVDLEEVYIWLGFSRKDHAKRLLTKKFTENVDYNIQKVSPPTGENSQNGGRSRECIRLTVPAFKTFSLLCDTEKSKQTIKYYLTMETIWFTYMQQHHKEMIDKITLEASKNLDKLRHDMLLRAYGKKPCVYAVRVGDDNTLVKLGETDDMYERIKTLRYEYKTEITLLECVPCDCPHRYEQYLLKKHALISPRTIKPTEFVQLDDIFTLEKLFDIMKKEVNTFLNKGSASAETLALENIARSKERLFIYQQIANATDETICKYWKQQLEDIKQSSNVVCVVNDVNIDEEQGASTSMSSSSSFIQPNRRVYKYNVDDLSNPIAEFISFKEAARSLNIQKIHDYHIRDACVNNTVFEGFRWYCVDNPILQPTTIPETCNVVRKPLRRLGLIAKISANRDKILGVFTSQNVAATSVQVASCTITVALTRNTQCAGFYWKMYDDCDDDLKATFEGTLPDYAAPKTCNKKVRIIDAKTNEVVETFECLQDACSKFGVCHKTIKTKSRTNETYKGYKWSIYDE